MHITVFGATGRTGRHVVARALDRGHEVTAFVRSTEGLDREHPNLTVVVGDAYRGENVDAAVSGADAVVSVLGRSSDSPTDLLTVAGRHVLDAMDRAGVDRFVTLVGAGVRTADESVSLAGRVVDGLLKLFARETLADANAHVDDVRDSDCRWTVVRAPRLGDGAGRGTYRAGEDVTLGFETVQRADVATFVLDVLEDDAFVHALPKVGA